MLREAGINPRNKEKYKRVGAEGGYGNKSAASSIAKLARENEAKEKRFNAGVAKAEKEAKEKLADKLELVRLSGEVVRLTEELRMEKAGRELSLANKELEVRGKLAEDLHNRYIKGIEAGAEIALRQQQQARVQQTTPLHTPQQGGI